jgi:hypothetical protein
MSDQPLNITVNTTDIATALPLIVDGTQAKVRLKNISQLERDSGQLVIKWEFALVDPAPTVDGAQVQAGFPLFVNFDVSRDFLLRKMATFIDGILGTGDINNRKGKPSRPALGPESVSQMLGGEAIAKIVVVKSTKSDYVGNDIDKLTYPGDLAAAA